MSDHGTRYVVSKPSRMNIEVERIPFKSSAWDRCSAEMAFCTIWALLCHQFRLLPKDLLCPYRRTGMARLSLIPYREFEWPSFIPPIRGIQSSSWSSQLSEASPVSNFLKKGGGLHHVCYEIDDLESGLREARGAGLVIVADPAPAVAFDGRRIAWVCSKKRLLVELLERNRK